MIVEHEVIEQIELDELGWLLKRVCDLIRSLDKEPFVVLNGMWRAGLIEFVSSNGAVCPDYEVQELLREGGENAEARVVATDVGSTLA